MVSMLFIALWLSVSCRAGLFLQKSNTLTERLTGHEIANAWAVGVEYSDPSIVYFGIGYQIKQIQNGVITHVAGKPVTTGCNYKDGVLTLAEFCNPRKIEPYAAQKFFVADASRHLVRKVDIAADQVTNFCGYPGSAQHRDGIGTYARLYNPMGIAESVAAEDRVFVSSLNFLHTVKYSTRETNTLAGDSSLSYSKRGYKDGQYNVVRFNYIYGLTYIPSEGIIYLVEYYNHAIRRVNANTGYTETVAGGLGPGRGGRDGPVSYAQYSYPRDIKADLSQNPVKLYLTQDHRVKAIDTAFFNTSTITSTSWGSRDGVGAAARIRAPRGLAIARGTPQTTLYVACYDFSNIVRLTEAPTASPPTASPVASPGPLPDPQVLKYQNMEAGYFVNILRPYGIDIDHGQTDGTVLYVSSLTTHSIYKIKDMTPTTGTSVYVAGVGIRAYGDGVLTNAGFNYPYFLTVDAPGLVYIADYYGQRIRKMDEIGNMVTSLSSRSHGYIDGPSSSARLNYPRGLDIDDAARVIYFSCQFQIRKYDMATAIYDTVAGAVDLAGTGHNGGMKDGIGTNAMFYSPYCLQYDPDDHSAYVMDHMFMNIRKIKLSNQEVTTYAGKLPGHYYRDGWRSTTEVYYPGGMRLANINGVKSMLFTERGLDNLRRMNMQTDVSYLVAGHGQGDILGVGKSAKFNSPYDVVYDHQNPHLTMYVTDYGNNRIRIVHEMITATPTYTQNPTSTPTATLCPTATLSPTRSPQVSALSEPFANVETIATSVGNMRSIALDSEDEPNPGDQHSVIYTVPYNKWQAYKFKIDSSGTWQKTTIAGSGSRGYKDGFGTLAQFNYPWGTSYLKDAYSRRRLYVGAYDKHTVRMINLDTNYGMVTTLVGLYGSASNQDGGFPYVDIVSGPRARIYYPRALCEDKVLGDLFIGDYLSLRRANLASMMTTSLTTVLGGYSDGGQDVSLVRYVRDCQMGPNNILYFTDESDTLRKIDLTSLETTTIVGKSGAGRTIDGMFADVQFRDAYGIAVDLWDSSVIYLSDSSSDTIHTLDIVSGQSALLVGTMNSGNYNDGIGTIARVNGIFDIDIDPLADTKTIIVGHYENSGRIRQIGPLLTYAPTSAPTIETIPYVEDGMIKSCFHHPLRGKPVCNL